MADNDDDTPDNVVPFRAAVADAEQDVGGISNQIMDMSGDALIALMGKYSTVAIVGWHDEDEVLDVISAERDSSTLYELLQQAASNIALEALDTANTGTFH